MFNNDPLLGSPTIRDCFSFVCDLFYFMSILYKLLIVIILIYGNFISFYLEAVINTEKLQALQVSAIWLSWKE